MSARPILRDPQSAAPVFTSDAWDYDAVMRRVACLGVAVASVALAAGGAASFAAPSGWNDPPGTFNGCPRGLQPLPAAAGAWQPQARAAATVFLRTTYARWNRERHWHEKLAGAIFRKALPVRRWVMGAWVKSECGRNVWARSVMVDFDLPAMGPCESCAKVVLLLGKTHRGWIAWGQGN